MDCFPHLPFTKDMEVWASLMTNASSLFFDQWRGKSHGGVSTGDVLSQHESTIFEVSHKGKGHNVALKNTLLLASLGLTLPCHFQTTVMAIDKSYFA